MPLTKIFERLADDQEAHNALEAGLQKSLGLFSGIYGTGATLNRLLHDSGVKARRTLPATVFSVGNISLGGTGKTPFTEWLTTWLYEQNRRPVILTRGYGREDEDKLVVVSNGKKVLAGTRDAGDEPVLMARNLVKTPVLACANRYRAGRFALRKFDVDTVVLDDGFQHHDLHRQADIVLVDGLKPLSEMKVFPRGTLRESTKVLSRAHLIVITRWNQSESAKKVYREIRQVAPSVPVVRTGLSVSRATLLKSGKEVPLQELNEKKVYMLCGLGNPASFRKSVNDAGMKISSEKVLRDHERVTRRQLKKIESKCRKDKISYIVVTKKDAVKIEELGRFPSRVLVIESDLKWMNSKEQANAEKVLKGRLHARLVRGFLK